MHVPTTDRTTRLGYTSFPGMQDSLEDERGSKYTLKDYTVGGRRTRMHAKILPRPLEKKKTMAAALYAISKDPNHPC